MPQLKSGILIAIEGIDGSGKSTLARNISSSLEQQGFNTLLTKEPGDSQLGKEIRELVCAQNIAISPMAQYLLFAADRAQHFTELIIPALADNKLIICDRLADSSLAYQSYGNGVDMAMVKSINAWSTHNIMPDLTIFVRVPVETALERCGKRGALSAYEKKDFLYRVANGFEEIYKNRNNVIMVDGTESADILTKQTLHTIVEWIQIKKLLS
jgi:dTMP kinase